MIKFRCESCGQKLGVPDNFAGKKVRCTGCAAPVRVPGEAAAPKPAQPAQSKPQSKRQSRPPAPAKSTSVFDELGKINEPAGFEDVEEFDELEEVESADPLSGFSAPSRSDGFAGHDDDGGFEELETVEPDADPFAGLAQFSTAPTMAPPPQQQARQSRPRSPANPGSKTHLRKAAYISLWSGIGGFLLMIPVRIAVVQIVARVWNPFMLLNPTVQNILTGIQILGMGLLLVGFVTGIMGQFGVKYFPNEGLRWRAVTGLVVSGLMLALVVLLLLLAVAAAASRASG